MKDLDFIYTQILENHPGIYNDKDPDFSDNLKNFYTTAKSTIKEASINSNPKTIISNFTKSFKDTHLSVHWFDNTISKKSTILSKFSSSEISDEIEWITLPTFDLHIEQQKILTNSLNNS